MRLPPWSVVQIGLGREQVFSHRKTKEEAQARADWLNAHMNAEGTLRYEVRPTAKKRTDPDPEDSDGR